MDRSRVEEIIRSLLVELGEDPSREGLAGTPARAADLLAMFALREPALPAVEIRPAGHDRGQMTVARDLPFFSLCEHHLLPFFGSVHIGCVPRERTCDPSFYSRVIESFAHRPQLQERLTEQIAEALMEALEPEGIGIAAEGRHMCMMMPGVEKQNAVVVTSSVLGTFESSNATRAEFLALIGRPGP